MYRINSGGSRTASLKNCFIDKPEGLNKATGERQDNANYTLSVTHPSILQFLRFL